MLMVKTVTAVTQGPCSCAREVASEETSPRLSSSSWGKGSAGRGDRCPCLPRRVPGKQQRQHKPSETEEWCTDNPLGLPGDSRAPEIVCCWPHRAGGWVYKHREDGSSLKLEGKAEPPPSDEKDRTTGFHSEPHGKWPQVFLHSCRSSADELNSSLTQHWWDLVKT